MLELLNTKIFDNERNILNADLFVNNLKHTFKAFKFNTKITYEVYRNITIYHITWNDDKSYEDMLELKKEIALALGVTTNEFEIEKEKENEVKIKVQNMKKSTLSLKELLEESKDKDNNNIPLGLSEEDKVIYFNIEKDKNLLVTGVTGIGKTNLFNNIILNILMNKDKTKIIILDSQSINYNAYDKLCEVVNNEQEIINKIKEIRHIFEEKVKNNDQSRIILFIDEIYEIIKNDISVFLIASSLFFSASASLSDAFLSMSSMDWITSSIAILLSYNCSYNQKGQYACADHIHIAPLWSAF